MAFDAESLKHSFFSETKTKLRNLKKKLFEIEKKQNESILDDDFEYESELEEIMNLFQ